MAASRYPEMLAMIDSGRIDVNRLNVSTLTLEAAAVLLANENLILPPGVSVIDRFSA